MSKTILITGSTDGIGKLAAFSLAEAGHSVYLHGRNAEKLESLINEIKSKTANMNVDGFVADFSTIDAAQSMAKEVLAKLPKLDVLINNAGVFKIQNSKNSLGQDLRFVVNYLVPIALTQALLPLLKKSDHARIINLSSAAQAPVSLSALNNEIELSDQQAYAQSKLALTMWSFDLAKKENDLSVIALNPGSLLNTNMVREAYGSSRSSADKGSNIMIELSLLEQYNNDTGKYFDNDIGKFGPAHPDAYDDNKIGNLLEVTKKLLEP